MRLSRPRLLLRASLLLVASGFMAWRCVQTRATVAGLGPGTAGAVTLGRIALIEGILAALALLTAVLALLSLRARPPSHPLHLGGLAGPGPTPGSDPGLDASPDRRPEEPP